LLNSGPRDQFTSAVSLSATDGPAPAGTALSSVYQLDFTTPGNLPWDAKTRKQIRQIPNFLK